ncbi:MAG: hypothetical protein M3R27_10280 [Bacteroidota bacterium]|nr:hypothetical protein [Bacteroidota bacterium]
MELFNYKITSQNYQPVQFKTFRIILGMYLLLHFLFLLPYSTEMFSEEGIFAQPELNFTYGYFPDWLYQFDSAMQVKLFFFILILASALFITGRFRRIVSFILWYGWVCLLNRNNLIINPGMPYIGWLLMACVFIPEGENNSKSWSLPNWCLLGAWLIMSLGYFVSGLDKLNSPSWLNGDTFGILLDNPLSRDTILRDWSLHIPASILRGITWLVLVIELIFLPLALFSKTRKYAWALMVGLHLSILCYIKFTDLTIGMLMIHVFTFDKNWLPVNNKLALSIK